MNTKSLKSSSPQQHDCKHQTSQRSLIPVFTLMILTHHTDWECNNNSADGNYLDIWAFSLTIWPFFIIQKTQPAFIPTAGKLAQTQMLLSAALALTDAYPSDLFEKSSQGYKIELRSSLHLDLTFLSLEVQYSAGTFARRI